jgi:hypothetical protein
MVRAPLPPARRRPAVPLTLGGLAVVALAGCSGAQEAVSSASASAQQAAQRKAQEVAVEAFRSQVCSMTADGALSKAEVSRLGAELDAAAAAGLPQQVVTALRPMLAQGTTASSAQVKRVHTSTCGS